MAKEMGVSREGLYKSFSGNRKPNIETIFSALDKLGMRITITPKPTAAKKQKVKA
jgi:DNA-binding phage protein